MKHYVAQVAVAIRSPLVGPLQAQEQVLPIGADGEKLGDLLPAASLEPISSRM